ncbi:glycosyltransferase family 2 protein [Candidatus Woesebacteria bacterium]|nr:glycosyltransferase family 2 protein [Candidatus Woesebacteria bacterium]
MLKNLHELILSHNNNYGFDPYVPIYNYLPKTVPSFSVIIPYFETGAIFKLTLKHLYNSIRTVQGYDHNVEFEVIVVDDGSVVEKRAKDIVSTNDWQNLNIIVDNQNLGRTSSRNIGLKNASKEICIFMDSDVLIDTSLIFSALKIHSYNYFKNNRRCITVGFFKFTNSSDPLIKYDLITPSDVQLNDYRLYCTYGPTWIHSEEDKQFVGQSFSIVHETNFFRDWKGNWKAWILPLMAMGGFYAVNRREAVNVGYFNESFKGYGYTETSVPSKLIAKYNDFLIPILSGGSIHVDDKITNISREEKDRIFKIKHDFYYNKFLKLNIKEAEKDILLDVI